MAAGALQRVHRRRARARPAGRRATRSPSSRPTARTFGEKSRDDPWARPAASAACPATASSGACADPCGDTHARAHTHARARASATTDFRWQLTLLSGAKSRALSPPGPHRVTFRCRLSAVPVPVPLATRAATPPGSPCAPGRRIKAETAEPDDDTHSLHSVRSACSAASSAGLPATRVGDVRAVSWGGTPVGTLLPGDAFSVPADALLSCPDDSFALSAPLTPVPQPLSASARARRACCAASWPAATARSPRSCATRCCSTARSTSTRCRGWNASSS